MEYSTTIEIQNNTKQISLKPALYKNAPIWEITLDDQKYIIRKAGNSWDQSSDHQLSDEILEKIGEAIDSYMVSIKDAG